MSDNEKDIFGTQNDAVNDAAETEKISEPVNEPVNEPINEPVEEPASQPYATAEKATDYSAYNDPVEDEAPKAPREPEYSPYSNNGYTGPQYNSYSAPYAQATVETAVKKKNTGFKAFIIVLAAVVVFVAVFLAVRSIKNNKDNDANAAAGDSTKITISDTPTAAKTSSGLTTEEIAAKAKKYNVGILLYGKAQSFTTSASNSLVGEGSGIVMGKDSTGKYTYILTCAHVISGVKTSGYTMTVQDCDGNTYDGILVGYDEKTDVGVIKIQKTGLTAAEFGDSSKLAIGQAIYAIGNPGGTEFFGSFTNGLISSIDRPISSESGYEMKCIQHTAPINSGNSGGALLNAYGQVIGINSSKIVSTGYEGMAFAIPITDAQTIINDIISNGYVTNRPKLGISYASATNYQQYSMIVKMNKLPNGSLIIAKINSDSALKNTDAKVGDLITAVNGESMETSSVLLDKIQNGKVGEKLKLTICRVKDDYSIDKFDIDVTLVEDTGATSTADEEQTTTQNYFEQYFGSGF